MRALFAAFLWLALATAALAQSVPPFPTGAAYQNTSGLLTDSNNFTVPAGVTKLLIAMQAGGGGGGGVTANVNVTAPGGASGEFKEFFIAVTPGQVIAYSNGAGGTGGAAGNNAGTNGSNAVFGSVTAIGGLGQAGSASGNTAANNTGSAFAKSGAPPTATVQILSTSGNNGLAGSAGAGGIGAGSTWGPPTNGTTNAGGTNATGYGAGGSGAGSTSTTSALAGGNGSASAIQVWW